MNVDEKKILFLAKGFNSGNAPFAPGTFGTLSGIPLCIFLGFISYYAGIAAASLIVISFIIFSVVIAEKAVVILNEKDPGCIVIDEIAGLLVTCLGVGINFYTITGAVLLFRFFDILKPFPANYLDRNIPGGAGVVLDDIAAGIMANIVLRIIVLLC